MYFTKNNLLFLVLLIIISCQNEVSTIDKVKTTSTLPLKESAELEIAISSSIFSEKEKNAILAIKTAFDYGLADGKEIKDYAQLYKNHAHRMRADYFNKFPYTLNFPYNDKFDLSQIKEKVKDVSFLTNKCGMQQGDKGNIIHYLCLKDRSTYMTFLTELGKKNNLIQSIVEDYKKNKSISANARHIMLLDSFETLDFKQQEHQIFYAFFQILVNEERLATDKLKTLASGATSK